MPLLKQKKLLWTHHAREKMGYYRLSEQRVRSVLHSPKRIEEGVAPKTVAMMQPSALRGGRGIIGPSPWKRPKPEALPSRRQGLLTGKEQTWSQEIWVMVQDVPSGRKVISAWRYPGVSKVRGEITGIMKSEYDSYIQKK